MGKARPARRRDRKVGTASYAAKGKCPYRYSSRAEADAVIAALQATPRRGKLIVAGHVKRSRS